MRSFFSVVTLVVIALVTVSAAAIIWTSKNMEGQISRRMATSLETVLKTTQQSLRIWQQEITTDATFVANSHETRTPIEKLAALPHQYTGIGRRIQHHGFRAFLRMKPLWFLSSIGR